MKRIEKDIKKNSTKLIESSLPEISSLDNLSHKQKNKRDYPLFFVPLGVAAVAIAAIMVPVVMRQVAPESINNLKPGNSNYRYSNNEPNDPGYTNPQTNHTYHFDFANYRPTFSNFNEVAYYSYIAYRDSLGGVRNINPYKSNKAALFNGENTQSQDERRDYVDAYGRYHYPISLSEEYTFSKFVYFEFDSSNCSFLEERIGNGHIRGLTLHMSIFDEDMLILKNGEHYYSCLCNGTYHDSVNQKWSISFSAHKTIEGFDVIKDLTNMRYVTLETTNGNDFSAFSNINFEGEIFQIDPDTVHYDNISVSCSLEQLRESLNLNPEYHSVDGYGGLDTLVYDATQAENNTFTLDEFEGTFSIHDGAIYLDERQIAEAPNTTKIYASEMNKDNHRDLVFETVLNEARYFNIIDVKNSKVLYSRKVSLLGQYEYRLAMRNNRLVVEAFAEGINEEIYIVDYGYFVYYANEGATIGWQNLYEVTHMSLNGVYQMDGQALALEPYAHYLFSSETPYIIEFEMHKYPGNSNPDYPNPVYIPIVCTPYEEIQSINPDFNFISMENGIYRYQVTFHDVGIHYYEISFYGFSFDLRTAVDYIPEPEIIIEE